MKKKIITGGIIIIAGIVFAVAGFFNYGIEYGDFAKARKSLKKIQVRGEWVRERESYREADRNCFVFYLKDVNGEIQKVVFDGTKPDNFENASNIVVKGRYEGGYFHATGILTRCPSKYDGYKY